MKARLTLLVVTLTLFVGVYAEPSSVGALRALLGKRQRRERLPRRKNFYDAVSSICLGHAVLDAEQGLCLWVNCSSQGKVQPPTADKAS